MNLSIEIPKGRCQTQRIFQNKSQPLLPSNDKIDNSNNDDNNGDSNIENPTEKKLITEMFNRKCIKIRMSYTKSTTTRQKYGSFSEL